MQCSAGKPAAWQSAALETRGAAAWQSAALETRGAGTRQSAARETGAAGTRQTAARRTEAAPSGTAAATRTSAGDVVMDLAFRYQLLEASERDCGIAAAEAPYRHRRLAGCELE